MKNPKGNKFFEFKEDFITGLQNFCKKCISSGLISWTGRQLCLLHNVSSMSRKSGAVFQNL